MATPCGFPRHLGTPRAAKPGPQGWRLASHRSTARHRQHGL